jgi:beta-galactosidase
MRSVAKTLTISCNPSGEEVEGDDGRADNVFDLQPTTYWHTQWEAAQPAHPHQLVLDLESEQRVAGLRCLSRQISPNDRIKDYRIYLRAAPFAVTKAQ